MKVRPPRPSGPVRVFRILVARTARTATVPYPSVRAEPRRPRKRRVRLVFSNFLLLSTANTEGLSWHRQSPASLIDGWCPLLVDLTRPQQQFSNCQRATKLDPFVDLRAPP